MTFKAMKALFRRLKNGHGLDHEIDALKADVQRIERDVDDLKNHTGLLAAVDQITKGKGE